jgi:WD40 repeat protein
MKVFTCFAPGQFAALFFAIGCGSDSGMIDPAPQGEGTRPSLMSGRYSDWSDPVNLGPAINTAFPDQGPYVSKDELSLYFASQRPAPEGVGANDLYVSTRKHKHDAWGPGVNLGSVINTPLTESTPALSRDEKLLYFASNGHPGASGVDIWVSARKDKRDPLGWGVPVKLVGGVNSAADDLGPAPFYDRRTKTLTLYFYSVRSGGLGCRDIYGSTQRANGEFSPAVHVTELNTPSDDEQPAIRRDGLEIFFSSNRPATPCQPPGTPVASDIYVSTRASTSHPWLPPENLGPPINTSCVEGRPSCAEGRPALSFDGRSLYFFSDGHGGEGSTDLFVSTRTRLDDDGDGDDVQE